MQKENKLFKSTVLLAVITVAVKLIGFVKQIAIAHTYGATVETDIYLISTDFIGEVGVVLFSSLTITLLTMYVSEKSKRQDINVLISNTLVVFLGLAFVISIIVCLFSKQIAVILAPGFSVEDIGMVSQYVKMFSFALVAISMCNIWTTVLNAESNFIHGKIVGAIQSACVILTCVILAPRLGIKALLIGAFFSYIIQSIYLFMFVKKYIKFKPVGFLQDKRVKKIFLLSMPLFLSNSLQQINMIVDKSIGTTLGEGAVTFLTYGRIIVSTIHSIVIANVCTVLFTYISESVNQGLIIKVKLYCTSIIRILCFILFPCVAICISQSDIIIRLVYFRGILTEFAMQMIVNAFIGYSFGIIFIAIRDVTVQVLYALQKTKEAMISGFIGVAINVVFSIVLAKYFGIFGIAISDGVSYFVAMFVGQCFVKRDIGCLVDKNCILELIKMIIAVCISVFLSTLLNVFTVNYYMKSVLKICVIIVFYILISKIIRVRTCKQLELLISERGKKWTI